MKRKYILLPLLLLLIIQLTSCSNSVSVKETKELSIEFLEAIVANDQDKAKDILHPSAKDSDDVIKNFITQLEENGINLEGEVSDLKVSNISTAVYTSEYQGGSCEIQGSIKVGNEKYNFNTTVIKNSEGYGIIKFNISKQ